MTKLVEQNNAEEREIFVGRPDLRTVETCSLGQLVGCDQEPGKMQVNLDAVELEETNRAAHEGKLTAEITIGVNDFWRDGRCPVPTLDDTELVPPVTPFLQGGRAVFLPGNQEAHR